MLPKLLITGGSGMVGQNILNHPFAKSWEIFAPSSNELNLTNTLECEKYISKKMPNLIIHSAGKVGGIKANIAEPVEFLDKNIMIGRNVIMGARLAGVKNLINLASTCIYPRLAENPLNEELILKGELEPTNEGYAIAKIFSTRLCEFIRREDPTYQYKTLIPCNLYGLYDKFDPNKSHLVPAIIHKIHQAKISNKPSVEIWGDGNARREFMYSADLADAVFNAAKNMEILPNKINIGIGNDYTINEYYETIAEVLGWNGVFTHDLSKPVGMMRKLCDTSLQSNWGWKPKTSLKNGLTKTYQYYLETLK
ncbi:GDP-L-fucose synthase [Amylibacter sp.]|jgi:GDP-L-fucose synthase|nr:GDP-L-fucose synthase [Amylibacter sp.]